MRPRCFSCGDCASCRARGLGEIDPRPLADRELERLAREAFGDDVELRYLASGDEGCRRTDVAIVRELESGFVHWIDGEVELLPGDLDEACVILRARIEARLAAVMRGGAPKKGAVS